MSSCKLATYFCGQCCADIIAYPVGGTSRLWVVSLHLITGCWGTLGMCILWYYSSGICSPVLTLCYFSFSLGSLAEVALLGSMTLFDPVINMTCTSCLMQLSPLTWSTYINARVYYWLGHTRIVQCLLLKVNVVHNPRWPFVLFDTFGHLDLVGHQLWDLMWSLGS